MTFPNITISSYQHAYDLLGSTVGLQFKHVISINNPKEHPPRPLADHPGRHLILHFHDITGPPAGDVYGPSRKDVEDILEFAEDIEQDHDVLVHCAAGISRSSAAALGILASKLEPSKENGARAIKELLDVKRVIHPNTDMVADIDHLLEYDGHLVKALHDVFGDQEVLWMPPELEALTPDDFE